MDSYLLADAESVVARARAGDPSRPGGSSIVPSRPRSTTSPAGSAGPPKMPKTCCRRPSSRSAAASGATARREVSGAGSGPSPPARRSCASAGTSTARPTSCTTRSSGTGGRTPPCGWISRRRWSGSRETSRAVVWLHDVEGYTHEEIATMMGKTPELLEVAAGAGAPAAPALAGGGGGAYDASAMEALVSLREPGVGAGRRGRPGASGELCPAAGPSSSGCTSGWPGSRRCRRSGPAGIAGPRWPARVRAERRHRRAGSAGWSGWPRRRRSRSASGVGRPPARLGPRPSEIQPGHGPLPGAGERAQPVRPRTAGCWTGAPRGSPRSWRTGSPGWTGSWRWPTCWSSQARDAQLLQLWRERVGLLDALVDVHVTRASNAGL